MTRHKKACVPPGLHLAVQGSLDEVSLARVAVGGGKNALRTKKKEENKEKKKRREKKSKNYERTSVERDKEEKPEAGRQAGESTVDTK